MQTKNRVTYVSDEWYNHIRVPEQSLPAEMGRCDVKRLSPIRRPIGHSRDVGTHSVCLPSLPREFKLFSFALHHYNICGYTFL